MGGCVQPPYIIIMALEGRQDREGERGKGNERKGRKWDDEEEERLREWKVRGRDRESERKQVGRKRGKINQ